MLLVITARIKYRYINLLEDDKTRLQARFPYHFFFFFFFFLLSSSSSSIQTSNRKSVKSIYFEDFRRCCTELYL